MDASTTAWTARAINLGRSQRLARVVVDDIQKRATIAPTIDAGALSVRP